MQAGVVTINDVLLFGEPAAWSGYRKSGIGQNHSTPDLREMSRQRFVSFDPSAARSPVMPTRDAEADRMVSGDRLCTLPAALAGSVRSCACGLAAGHSRLLCGARCSPEA
jgi:hypothetical protein